MHSPVSYDLSDECLITPGRYHVDMAKDNWPRMPLANEPEPREEASYARKFLMRGGLLVRGSFVRESYCTRKSLG